MKDGTKEGDTSSFIKNGEWELIGKEIYLVNKPTFLPDTSRKIAW